MLTASPYRYMAISLLFIRKTPTKVNFRSFSFVRSFVARFFRRRQKFSTTRKWKKAYLCRCDRFRPRLVNFGTICAIFKPVKVLKIHHATFWRIQPVVPGFMRICLWFAQILGRSAEFAKKWHTKFSIFEKIARMAPISTID